MQLFGDITFELSLEARVPLRSFSTSAVCPVFQTPERLKGGKREQMHPFSATIERLRFTL